jgi:hypothetical protein
MTDDAFSRAINEIERLGGAEAVIKHSLESININFTRTKDTEFVALQPPLLTENGDIYDQSHK